MYIRKCNVCGWEYPPSHVALKCSICGSKFDVLTCYTCGEIKPVEMFEKNRNVCKECRRKSKKENWHRHLDNLDKQFDEWLDKIKQVPKDYPSLTEAQWLEACKHFDGCARCQNKEIDTRGFFVGAKLGGRYCDWNVIPLCERCASNWNLDKSALRYIEKRAYNYKNLAFKERLVDIIKYLEVRLNNAITKTKT